MPTARGFGGVLTTMTDPSDMLMLARLQFAFTVSFHILFPAFTIGLASWLVTLEALWLYTGKELYRSLYDFWLRPFALSFGMGVVSGVVMSYQFGTNWSHFSEVTGNVLGPLLGYEVLAAFFLEASFLGVMLFGRGRVSDKMHLVATALVALGTLVSAFWIIAANSWMHTPAGYALQDGRFVPVDWARVIFNPSMPYRLAHMVLACFLSTALVVAGVGAYHALRGTAPAASRSMLAMALPFLLLVGVAQLVAGHEHGVQVYEYQPVKLAAIEGDWESHERAAPLILFALPDGKAEDNRWELAIPSLGSLVVTGSVDGAIRGLRSWPPDERPPVAVVFWSFRLMVGLGVLIVLVGTLGTWFLWRGRIDERRWFLRLCIAAAPGGFLAVLAGWVTAEVGRQPYVVQGLLRTADAVSPVSSNAVGLSLLVFVTVYSLIFGAGISYLLALLRRAPDEPEDHARGRVAEARIASRSEAWNAGTGGKP